MIPIKILGTVTDLGILSWPQLLSPGTPYPCYHYAWASGSTSVFCTPLGDHQHPGRDSLVAWIA